MDRDATAKTVRVWDPFVRIAHWSLVILFAVSYLSEGEPEWLHTWSGYIIAGLVVLRILWGFVGSQHARFSDFVTGPFKALRYLVDMLRGTSPRYLGHSPAGGAMTIALILALLVTTGTGMALLAADKGRGPLAGVVARSVEQPAAGTTATATDLAVPEEDEDDERGETEGGEGVWGEIHELAANLTLVLVILHILGVAAASYAHKENLPRSMVTGEKRA